jgi:outer membrane protein
LRLVWLAASLAAAFTMPAWPVDESPLRVGVLADGPMVREVISSERLAREAAAVLGDAAVLVFPPGKGLDGGWTLEGVNAAFDRLQADPSVDAVVTIGIIGSHVAGQRRDLAKPTVAAIVGDPQLQGFPVSGGASGRKNLTYIADFKSIGEKIRIFQRVTGFRHLAVLVDQLWMDAIPELHAKGAAIESELGVRLSIVHTSTVSQALQGLPADADAVAIAALFRLDDAALRDLAQALAERKLPTFDLLGQSDLERGFLMATSTETEDVQRLSRRIVLDLERIARGEDAAKIEVGFTSEQRLIFNMRTARAIGYSPRWTEMADAILLHEDESGDQPPLTLQQAMQEALRRNPGLRASLLGVDIAADQTREARAELLPSLNAFATRTRIDADRASPLIQSEESTSVSGELTQLIYSDRAWAGYQISRRQKLATDEEYRAATLDMLDQTASSYLGVLRAKSAEAVRRQNLENTRKNLEIARVREAVGLGGRSDYLRWVAQVARAKQELLSAQSQRRQANVELARLLGREVNEGFDTVEGGLDDPLALVADQRTQQYVDTPVKWAMFQTFTLDHALRRSPELAQVDQLILGQDRAVTGARRAFFLPDFALAASDSEITQRGGAGSVLPPGAPDDQSWSVSLRASLPLFTAGANSAALSRARHQRRQLEAQRAALADSVRARAQVALERVRASHPSIALSAEAAAAARENYNSVTEAYSRGLVTVTELIDAQGAALDADLAQADAKYTFLIDFVGVLRASGSFDLLLDPASRSAWYDEVDRWFRGQSKVSSP